MIKLYNGDCLVESDKIASGSADLILTDLPYGTMKGLSYAEHDKYRGEDEFDWDEALPTGQIMSIANRILRKNGKMILFSQDPFTTELITGAVANLPFNYRMIWEKNDYGHALIAKKAPLNYYEDVLVFSKKHDYEALHPLRPYFTSVMAFIGLNLKGINDRLGHRRAEHCFYVTSSQFGLCTENTYNELIAEFGINEMGGFREYDDLIIDDNTFKKDLESTFNLWDGKKHKSNILTYKKDYDGYHPTQKPVLLLEDLIKTFSNPGDLIVDLTMGSGSTGVACVNTDRDFTGIELGKAYFDVADNRINKPNKLCI